MWDLHIRLKPERLLFRSPLSDLWEFPFRFPLMCVPKFGQRHGQTGVMCRVLMEYDGMCLVNLKNHFDTFGIHWQGVSQKEIGDFFLKKKAPAEYGGVVDGVRISGRDKWISMGAIFLAHHPIELFVVLPGRFPWWALLFGATNRSVACARFLLRWKSQSRKW